MTNKYYVLVAGTGDTSRANIEALMEDYYYSKGDEGTLVVAYEKSPTKAQVFAAQYAKESNKDITVFCNEDASTLGIPGASQFPSADPIKFALDNLQGQDAVAYLIWNEDDTQLLASCISAGVPAFNLSDGLVPLNEVPIREVVAETPSAPVKIAPPEQLPLESDPMKEFKEELKRHIKANEEILKRLG